MSANRQTPKQNIVHRPINLRDLLLTVGGVTACVLFFQLCGESLFQWGRSYRWIASEISVWVGLLVLVIWLGFTSRLPPKTRLIGALLLVLLFVAFLALFRIKRDGDLVPYAIQFRWVNRSAVIDANELAPRQPANLDANPLAKTSAIGQFLGPNRDGMWRDVHLAADWNRDPPREIWRQPIGGGYSSCAMVGDYLFTQEMRDDREFVTCYQLRTGEAVWRTESPGCFASTWTGGGPRATPTVVGGRVYAMGGTGRLSCFEAASGQLIWSTNPLETFQAENTTFGKSCSPLVVADLVVVTGGGETGPSLIAYDANTGELRWSSAWGTQADETGTIGNSYASPLLASLHGELQIVNLEDKGVAAYQPESGRRLWRFPWPWQDLEPKVTQPVVLPDNRIWVSAAYASGCAVFSVTRDASGAYQTEVVWQNRRLKTKFSNVVVNDHYVFGLHDRILVCLDLQTGERVWRGDRFGHGQIILVGNHLVVVGEMGEVALVEATPAAYRELGRFQALKDRTWNSPAVYAAADPVGSVYLVLRNDYEMMCYQLARVEAGN